MGIIFLLSKVKLKAPRNRPERSEGGRGIALLFLDLSARRGKPVPNVQEAGWAPGPAGRV
jgi:hypothetical protein